MGLVALVPDFYKALGCWDIGEPKSLEQGFGVYAYTVFTAIVRITFAVSRKSC